MIGNFINKYKSKCISISMYGKNCFSTLIDNKCTESALIDNKCTETVLFASRDFEENPVNHFIFIQWQNYKKEI